MAASIHELSARIELLAIVVQEVCVTLAPAQRTQAAQAIRQRVGNLAAGDMHQAADEAIAFDLAPLLKALEG